MRHVYSIRILAVVVGLGLTFFSNCGKFAQSKSYQAQKAATISSTAVFSTDGNPAAGVTGQPRTPEAGEPGEPAPPAVPIVPTKLPVELYCSQDGVSIIGSTLATSPSALIYAFKDASGAEICSFREEGARDDLINTARVNISDLAKKCPALKDGNYVMTLKSPTGGKSMLMTLINMNDWLTAASYQQIQNLSASWIGQPLHVQATVGTDKNVTLKATDRAPCENLLPNEFYDYNGCVALYGAIAPKVLSHTLVNGLVPAYARCDHGVSPLIVRLGEETEGIKLSPPLSGIDFDIMGINAIPAHKPKRISWFTGNTAKGDYFVVLPNARGEVLGIDQMFGNNTVTPEGHKPPSEWNGYAALGLYDGRRHDGSVVESARDGFITPDDEIFASLRLWHDANRDGVADASELSTLADHKIERIDLTFDDGHPQVDDYGNETKMKSTVQTRDGRTHLIYDLWFRAL